MSPLRKVALIGAGALTLIAAVIVPPLMLLVGLIGEAHHVCVNGAGSAYGSVAGYTGPGVAGLNAKQTSHASAVVTQGRQMGIPDEGIVVALAVVSQESGFKVYANDGQGGDLAADQRGIERSLDLPHEAVGTDHGSLGLFQQQWPWWGSMQELMDPAISAAKFYEALREVDGWQDLEVTVAAQRVQRSAYPDAYADDEDLARELLASLGSNDASTGAVPAGGDPYGLGDVTPQLRALVQVLAPRFGITTVGGYRASATDMDGHPAGLAADFMVPLTPEGYRQGQTLATYAQRNAVGLGIDYIIWDQQIWSAARAREGWRPMEDRGSPTANHVDHPHINVLPDADPRTITASGGTGSAGSVGSAGAAGPGGGAVSGELDEICDEILPASSSAGGAVVHPMPVGADYVTQDNYGESGPNWSSYHTGTDFSAACGTPVLAAHAGTIRVDTDQSWSGQWLVVVETSPGQLSTWYAHMESLEVSDGDPVTPGQQIGTVGSEGNSTGCHLHFEVHPKGGGYAEDDVDPIPWLAANVGSAPVTPGGVPTGAPSGSGRLRVATYNIYQGIGGSLEGLARDIDASGADVVLLQEVLNHYRAPGGRHQAAWLARRLGMQYVFAPAHDKGGKTIGNAVLSRYPITQSTVVDLPRAGGSESRNALRAWVNVNGNLIETWSTHLHFGGSARARQASALSRAVGSPGCSTIVGGDLNFSPDLPMHRTVTRNLTDTFAGRADGRTVPAGAPRARIDYLLHSRQVSPQRAWVMPNGASDHRGVAAVMALDPAHSCNP